MIIEDKARGMVRSVLGIQGDGMSQLIRLIEPVYPQVCSGQTGLCLAFYVSGVLHAAVVRLERPCDGRGAL
jgi:hypothetical protein